MAEFLFASFLKEKNFEASVTSAGIINPGNKISHNSFVVLKEKGIDSSAHISRVFNKEMFDESDVIVAMTDEHKRWIEKHFAAHKNLYSMTHFIGRDVFDPYMMDLKHYKMSAKLIEDSFDKIFEVVSKLSNSNDSAKEIDKAD